MVETPTNCQEQFNIGKISMYLQLDNVMQVRLDEISKTILLLKFLKNKQWVNTQ